MRNLFATVKRFLSLVYHLPKPDSLALYPQFFFNRILWSIDNLWVSSHPVLYGFCGRTQSLPNKRSESIALRWIPRIQAFLSRQDCLPCSGSLSYSVSMLEQLDLRSEKQYYQDEEHKELLVELCISMLSKTYEAKDPIEEAEHIVDQGIH